MRDMFEVKIRQLTFSNEGHTLNNNQVFSPDDVWIVFDTRNQDTAIQTTKQIAMVNVQSGEERLLYSIADANEFGPGLGAASFSPVQNRVVFIHGIRGASAEKPYGFDRRTGVAIATDQAQQPIFMDARNIKSPYTLGALRGGTHAHAWSKDGQLLCFTYNDYVVNQSAKTNPLLRDLRTVGVMYHKSVSVVETDDFENFSGEMFAVLIAEVTENPQPGSNEIDRAFDECWVGDKGYMKPDGQLQQRAIAYQGNIRDMEGKTVTEIFIADIPTSINEIVIDDSLLGTANTRPAVPKPIQNRRLSYTQKGVRGPRHWLRSSPDGNFIYYLSEDEKGLYQVFSVSINNGETKQITQHNFSVAGQINISPDGLYLSYIADNSVCVTRIADGQWQRLSPIYESPLTLSGAVLWSNSGKTLAFNCYVPNKTDEPILQIFIIELSIW